MANISLSSKNICGVELDNFRSNILKKQAQLGLTLPKFAARIGMEHQTLWRLLNRSYLPSITSMCIVAKFFGVEIGDLLKYPNMPQYVPLLQMEEIESYLKETNYYNNNKRVLSDEFVSSMAFAIRVEVIQFDTSIDHTFIIKPMQDISEGDIFLVINNGDKRLIRIISIDKSLNVKYASFGDDQVFNIDSKKLVVIGKVMKQCLHHDHATS